MTTPESSPSPRIPLVVIVGPTAAGKTEISIQVAERLRPPGEIVSADSRTFYRGMDIGTAKPSPAERARVPHHLVDVTTPDKPWSLAMFQQAAAAAIGEIHRRGHVTLMVGGTGQYVRAILEGWELPKGEPDDAFRLELEAFAREQGAEALHARLAALDPTAAARIDPRNVRRVIRAMEVSQSTGRAFSSQRGKAAPPYSTLVVGLTRPREELYRRVDARIQAMLDAGLVEEVKRLVEQGHGWGLPAMSGVGYRQIGAYLRGDVSLDDAVREIKRATRNFVRHQANWFKPDDPNIHWFRVEASTAERVTELIVEWLEQPGA